MLRTSPYSTCLEPDDLHVAGNAYDDALCALERSHCNLAERGLTREVVACYVLSRVYRGEHDPKRISREAVEHLKNLRLVA